MKSKVLIVSNLTSAVNVLKSLLEENSCEVGAVVTEYQSAFDHANGTLYDIVVINYPVDECDCISLAKKISEETICGVVIIVPEKKSLFIGNQVYESGVVVINKPINKMLFSQLIEVVKVARKRYVGLSEENEKLKLSLEEEKIVNRAKLLLMQYLAMSEEHAHRYIEKQAMDMRISRLEVAKQVLRTYSAKKGG